MSVCANSDLQREPRRPACGEPICAVDSGRSLPEIRLCMRVTSKKIVRVRLFIELRIGACVFDGFIPFGR